MPNVWCVRADYGRFAEHFVKGGYAAIGWFDDFDIATVKDRQEVATLYPAHHPDDTSPFVIGQQVGQISRFLFEVRQGDYILTPSSEVGQIYYGKVLDGGIYSVLQPIDGCPFQHRRRVQWNVTPLLREQLSVPMQNSLKASLTIFAVADKDRFFQFIGQPQLASTEAIARTRTYTEVVLERVLDLNDKEFEILVTGLLKTLGFEAAHTGKVGDQGVDVEGTLNIYGLAKVKLYVQVKRYQPTTRIPAKEVRKLRQNIKTGEQGAFITTSDFQEDARLAGEEAGFARIGLMNGEKFIALLSDKWEELEQADELLHEILGKLRLRRGLIASE